MQISPIQVQYNKFACNKRKQSNAQSQISFKQVTPEHFFIKMSGYEKDYKWGGFVSELANKVKDNVLKSSSTVDNDLLNIAKRYHNYKLRSEGLFGDDFGIPKCSKHNDLFASIFDMDKYGEYYSSCKKLLKNNSEELMTRTISHSNLFTAIQFKACQVQNEVDGQKIVLTQFGYKYNTRKDVLDKDYIYLIHPPYQTSKILIPKAQKYLDELKPYKKKKLKEEDINKIYEKIGAIHWCLAQSMPFQRGSAALADVYAKGLFEALNIQTTPWKSGLAPDWEAFITPLDEYSKKYRSFFDKA